jgi:kinetochore protein NDC80
LRRQERYVETSNPEHEQRLTISQLNNEQRILADAQIEKLERELSRMRTSMTESVQSLEQREMNTNLEYEQLSMRANALREELHTEIERMLNDVIKFKVHIQKGLEEYEEFVAEETEKECLEQEQEEEEVNEEA